MPFFGSKGILGSFFKRRSAKRRAPEGPENTENDESVAWVGYTDRDGRPCWQNQKTAEWTYTHPNGANFMEQPHPPQQQIPVYQQVITPPMVPVAPAPFPVQYHPPGQQWILTPHGYQPMPAPWHAGMIPISPVPFFIPVLLPSPVQKEKETEQEKEKEKEKDGVWERKYDGDGGKYWEHSGTGQRARMDPFK